MTTKLIDHGRQILNKFGLQEKRKWFKFDGSTVLEPGYLQRFLTELLGESISLSQFEIINRVFNQNQSLKFHIDDCQIVSRRDSPVYDTHRFIPITDTLYIYINSKSGTIPRYTAVFYLSTLGDEFNGGIFEFVDGTQIQPVRNNGILFDSREVHRVTSVTSGIRSSVIVKIY
jgi:hypothetical protein